MEMEPESRIVYITAIDRNGQNLPVEINIFVNESKVGTLRLNEKSDRGIIEFPVSVGSIQLFATCQNYSQVLNLNYFENTYQFVFQELLRSDVNSLQAEAKCPDGRTGTPCVTCYANGIPYRICV